jgi:hypothetical protein
MGSKLLLSPQKTGLGLRLWQTRAVVFYRSAIARRISVNAQTYSRLAGAIFI